MNKMTRNLIFSLEAGRTSLLDIYPSRPRPGQAIYSLLVEEDEDGTLHLDSLSADERRAVEELEDE